jgi:hypothetical protein
MPVQTTNIHNPGDGIDFSAFDSWVIAPGVVVASDNGNAVYSAFAAPFLINQGTLIGGNAAAAFDLGTGGGSIVNDGTMSGTRGITFNASDDSAINFGSISVTFAGVAFVTSSHNSSLDNRGSIFSALDGIYEQSSNGGDSVNNSGNIEGLKDGLFVSMTATGLFVTVANSGTMRGGTDAIFQPGADLGALHLQNSGTLVGGIAILGPEGNDIVINSGTINGAITLAGSNNVVTNSGHINGPVTLGGNDVFNGAGGTSGPIDAGPGHNTLTGGAGTDEFVFDSALGPANLDLITNFQHHIDKIDLSQAIFTAAGPAGTLKAAAFLDGIPAHEHPATRIIYDPATASCCTMQMAGTMRTPRSTSPPSPRTSH